MPSRRQDDVARVVVVGQGVIGLSIAMRLLQSNYRVVCCDASQAGAASSVALGYVSPPSAADVPSDVVPFGAAALPEFLSLLEELSAIVGTAVPVGRSGYLHVSDVPGAADLDQIESSWLGAGLSVDRMSGEAARLLEPTLGRGVVGALLLRDALSVDSADVVSALREAVVRLGGSYRRVSQDMRVLVEDGVCVGVTDEAGVLPADVVVVCAGCWTDTVLGPFGLGGMEPIKGQVIQLHSNGRLLPSRPISTSDGLDLMPRASGDILLGSTNERVGYDVSSSAGMMAEILGRAVTVLPIVREYSFVGARAGLRPCSLDRRPIIGPRPGVEGLYVASGHCQDGILMSAITAGIVRAQLAGEHSQLPFGSSFLPGRAAPPGGDGKVRNS